MSAREPGQVVVEVLLILPVFLFLVFTIMEIGHLAFRTILIHHAAYEVARIGSLTTQPQGVPCQTGSIPNLDVNRMRGVAVRILPNARMFATVEPTLPDPQSECISSDVVVTIQQAVPLVFPLTGIVLGKPRGSRSRIVAGTVRMPIERPLFK